MFWSDDPVRDAERYFDDQDRRLERRPVCCYCEEHIQDEHYYLINGDAYCKGCLDDNFKKPIEDYID